MNEDDSERSVSVVVVECVQLSLEKLLIRLFENGNSFARDASYDFGWPVALP